MVRLIERDIKDIKATPQYKGNDETASDSPFKDSLEVHLQSMSDFISELDDYNNSHSQDDMKRKEIDKILRGISQSIVDLRKIMFPERNKKK